MLPAWILALLQLLPQLPGIISAIKHAVDSTSVEGMTDVQLDNHQKAKAFSDICHGAMCTK